MNPTLNDLKNKRLIWQASQRKRSETLSNTGFDELDRELDGGFPHQGVIDLHSPLGIGELRLLYPALQARQQQSGRILVFVAPPMSVSSEVLSGLNIPLDHVLLLTPATPEQALWSTEQCLKSGCCHSVLLWQQDYDIAQIKRLQLASEKGNALLVLLRQPSSLSLSLPVSLAMRLKGKSDGLGVEITKRKGGWPTQPFSVSMRNAWPDLVANPTPDNVIYLPRPDQYQTG